MALPILSPKVARELAGLSQSDAARRLGVARHTLARYEAAAIKLPAAVVARMEGAYSLTPGGLAGVLRWCDSVVDA